MPRGDGDGLDTLTVLRAHDGRRLTKRFTLAGSGAVIGQGYDNGEVVQRRARPPSRGIHDLHRELCRLESDPHACIIRGEAAPGTAMARTRRKKAENGGAFAEVPRRWVMLDIDGGVPLPPGCSVLADPEEAARVLLDVLAAHAPELEGVTAVVQFSASAGLDELAAGEPAADSGTPARLERRRQAGPPRARLVLAARAAGRGRAEALARARASGGAAAGRGDAANRAAALLRGAGVRPAPARPAGGEAHGAGARRRGRGVAARSGCGRAGDVACTERSRWTGRHWHRQPRRPRLRRAPGRDRRRRRLPPGRCCGRRGPSSPPTGPTPTWTS